MSYEKSVHEVLECLYHMYDECNKEIDKADFMFSEENYILNEKWKARLETVQSLISYITLGYLEDK